MKSIHLLLSPQPPVATADAFEPLIKAIREHGGRVGRLRWTPDTASDTASDDRVLTALTDAGVLRDVRVNRAGSIAYKARTGPAVLRDVVREHFRGCRVVLVFAQPTDELADLPRIFAVADRFRVEIGNLACVYGATELSVRLRRPGALVSSAEVCQPVGSGAAEC